jgi:hypothetical protein
MWCAMISGKHHAQQYTAQCTNWNIAVEAHERLRQIRLLSDEQFDEKQINWNQLHTLKTTDAGGVVPLTLNMAQNVSTGGVLYRTEI